MLLGEKQHSGIWSSPTGASAGEPGVGKTLSSNALRISAVSAGPGGPQLKSERNGGENNTSVLIPISFPRASTAVPFYSTHVELEVSSSGMPLRDPNPCPWTERLCSPATPNMHSLPVLISLRGTILPVISIHVAKVPPNLLACRLGSGYL